MTTSPSTSSPPPEQKRGKVLVYVLVAVGLLPFLCGFLGIVAAIAIPNFVAIQYRTKRSELPSMVDGIRTAQLAHHARTGAYLACGSEAAAKAVLASGNGKKQRDFPSSDADCWTELGWHPGSQVRGAYWTVVSADGSDVEIHGISDVDGDGDLAEFRADRTSVAVMVTDPHTY